MTCSMLRGREERVRETALERACDSLHLEELLVCETEHDRMATGLRPGRVLACVWFAPLARLVAAQCRSVGLMRFGFDAQGGI